jgi:hypothetical protein
MSKKKISTTVASVLATASLAIPATAARASVQWHANGALVGSTPLPTTFWGNLELQNAFLGNIKCQVIGSLPVRNEGGLAKVAVSSLALSECTSQPPCPGAFATAEAPVELLEHTTPPPKSEKRYEARRGPMSLPWQGEGLEEEVGLTRVRKVKLNVADLTEVVPCFSLEEAFEGTLEFRMVNGSKNAMHPGHLEIGSPPNTGGSLTSKALPSEKEENVAHLVGQVTDVGDMVQLITLE